MIDFLSSWAKTLSLAVIIVSILEMLLPNNKTKKYIRMVMGIYILFNIVSPFIKNVQASDFENINIENYVSIDNSVNQTAMDARLQELYIEQIEKDITTKVEAQGYDVTKCKVKAVINKNENETGIQEIKLKIEKNEKNLKEQSNVENKMVDEIQKIKKVSVGNSKSNNNKTTNADINNIKEFLKNEYGVDDKCLKIN